MGGVHIIPDRDSNGKVISHRDAFASKEIDGKKLYKRVHGIMKACTVGNNYFDFTVPYPSCKITGAEFIGAEVGDTADLFVLDTATGTVTTIANYPLNQFGFNVCVNQHYNHYSEYDADLFQGLQISVVLNSVSAKNVGINYILNELKD